MRDKNIGIRKSLRLAFKKTFLETKYAVSFFLHGVFALLGALVDPFFHTLHLLLYINISADARYIL